MNTQELLKRVREKTNMKFNRATIQSYVDRGILVKHKSGKFAVSGLETNDYTEDSVDALIKFFNALSIRATARYMSERLGIRVTVRTVKALYDGDLFHERIPQDELGELGQKIIDTQGMRRDIVEGTFKRCSAGGKYTMQQMADYVGCSRNYLQQIKSGRRKMLAPMYDDLQDFVTVNKCRRND